MEKAWIGVNRRPTEGVLRLVLRRVGSRTVVQTCYCQAPLRVMRPLYLDDSGTAYVYLLNPCGGVLGGDRYRLSITLEEHAQAYLTTPSATKLYAAPGAAAQQQMDVTLRPGAVFTYMPDQIIPFAQAAFQQRLNVHLDAGACVFLGDMLAPGRLARGEVFAYREYDARLRVETAQGRVLLLERTWLQPQTQDLSRLGLFEGYPYLGTFYALCEGRALPSSLSEDLHGRLCGRSTLVGSATQLESGGLAVRLLGTDHHGVHQALCDIWSRIRQHVLGYPAVAVRK